MATKLLRAYFSAWLAGHATSLMVPFPAASEKCISVPEIISTMVANPSKPMQLWGCRTLGSCTNAAIKTAQDAAAAAGSIDAAVAAIQAFPEAKEMLIACSHAIGQAILFNHPNGLHAGQLGGLNLTLAGYSKWMDDPSVTGSIGGEIGCYLDLVGENRAILRELGGVHLVIQNIRNNFHGQYSEWAYEPVKHSLFALSSGCWQNQDLCAEEGFIPLAISLMTEHTNATKIAEETLQAVKALIFHSDDYRRQLAEQGILQAMVRVLQQNPQDVEAVSLACESMGNLVGGDLVASPTAGLSWKGLDSKIQAAAMDAGAVQQLAAIVFGDVQMQQHDKIDAAYDAKAYCLRAIRNLAQNHASNQEAMRAMGLPGLLTFMLRGGSLNKRQMGTACEVLRLLARKNITKECPLPGAPPSA